MCFGKLDFSLPQLAFDIPEGDSRSSMTKTQLFEAAWKWALKLFRNTLWIVKPMQHRRYFNKWLNSNSPISWEGLGSHFLSVFSSCSLLSGMLRGKGPEFSSSERGSKPRANENAKPNRDWQLIALRTGCVYILYMCVWGLGVGVGACQISVCIYYEKANIPGEA